MQKRYGSLEQLLYTNPKEEASFLSGAFQSVSYGAASVVVGPLIALASLLITHKQFAKPHLQDDKSVRHAHLKGFATGLVLSLATGMACDAYFGADPATKAPEESEFSAAIEPNQPQHSQFAPAHI